MSGSEKKSEVSRIRGNEKDIKTKNERMIRIIGDDATSIYPADLAPRRKGMSVNEVRRKNRYRKG